MLSSPSQEIRIPLVLYTVIQKNNSEFTQHEKLRLTEADAEIADIAMYQNLMLPFTVFYSLF